MQSSIEIPLAPPLAVVCHDAGAASIAFSWLAHYAGAVRPCVQGPAAAQWSAAFPGIAPQPLDEAIEDAASLLSGTGWASDLEHRARRLARSRGIRSVAVIDHWVNYRERFVREGELVLPDEVWVSDDDARRQAESCFPQLTVRQFPNLYFERLAGEVAACAPQPPGEVPREILYVLEPIRQKWGADTRPGEVQAFEFFLDYLERSGLGRRARICLRPHPSDPPGKYDDWLSRYTRIPMAIDSQTSLPEQIARADWVVGCESAALVAAVRAGRIVLSTLPPSAPECRLPQREIRHVRELVRSAV